VDTLFKLLHGGCCVFGDVFAVLRLSLDGTREEVIVDEPHMFTLAFLHKRIRSGIS
jgi:hypothetical protein